MSSVVEGETKSRNQQRRELTERERQRAIENAQRRQQNRVVNEQARHAKEQADVAKAQRREEMRLAEEQVNTKLARQAQAARALTAEVVRLFDLEAFFPGLNMDLCVLACTRKGAFADPAIGERLGVRARYLNLEVLEFYGDTALDFLIVDDFRQFIGIESTPDLLSKAKSALVKNETLTELSEDLGICQVLQPGAFLPSSKHNLCGDNVEAIIGVLFYQFGPAVLPQLRRWLESKSAYRNRIQSALGTLAQEARKVEATHYPALVYPLEGKATDFIEAYEKRYPGLVFEFQPMFDEWNALEVVDRRPGGKNLVLFLTTDAVPNGKEARERLQEVGLWKGPASVPPSPALARPIKR